MSRTFTGHRSLAARRRRQGLLPRRGLNHWPAKLGHRDLTVYDDWQTLIGKGNCDVISIVTAPMLRKAPLLAALDHGCHVLVERPISVGVPEARVMVAAAEPAKHRHGMLLQLAIRAGLSDNTECHPLRPGRRDTRYAYRGYFRVRSQFSRNHFASPTPARSSYGSDTMTMSRSSWRSPISTRWWCPPTCFNTPRNRLIEDFIGAIRNDDKNHESIDDFFAAQTVCEGGGLG